VCVRERERERERESIRMGERPKHGKHEEKELVRERDLLARDLAHGAHAMRERE